ncbi:MAG TPA: polymer-forming cytoskeletal protein [Anaerolineales bacterium]|jgi:cytoskeletal protein CcmA (bactofilin family)|nr:polymer-forming cytoskeletal protein [Anaerolineales bacterium]
MFRKPQDRETGGGEALERVDSVLGPGISWGGEISGSGGVRIDGAFEGQINIRGLVVIGDQGRVTCEHIRAVTVIVAGSVKGNITARKVEIASTGRVWGDVVTTAFSTQEGAFLRGEIRMEEKLDLGLAPPMEVQEPPEGSEEV